MLSRQCLGRRLPDINHVRTEATGWTTARNDQQTGFDWQFTTADARIKLKSLYWSDSWKLSGVMTLYYAE
ncbi:MAG: hypothetical protein R3C02_09060 [Planctomycetaceae bacterium]